MHGQGMLFAYGQRTVLCARAGNGGEQNIRGGRRKACRSRNATGVPEVERGSAGLGGRLAGHWYGYTKRAVSYTSGEVVSAGGGAYI